MRAASESGLFLEESFEKNGIEDVLEKIYDVYVSFSLSIPPDTFFYETVVNILGIDGTLKFFTTNSTKLSLNISSSEVTIQFEPFVYIDVEYVKDQHITQVSYNFKTKHIDIVMDKNSWLDRNITQPEIIDRWVEPTLSKFFEDKIIKNTKLANTNYNPQNDTDLIKTMFQILENFKSL